MFCRNAIIIVISCRLVVVLAVGFVPDIDTPVESVSVVVFAAEFVPALVSFVVKAE